MQIFKIICVVLFTSFLLSACGGTSTTRNAPTPQQPPAPPPPPLPLPPTDDELPPNPGGIFNTAEYRGNWGLNAINPIPAYESAARTTTISPQATGAGVLVAVIDTGFNVTHPDLVNAYSPDSVDLYGRPEGIAATNLNPGVNLHGSGVASIVAAAKNDSGMHGIAFEATILAIRMDPPGACDNQNTCGVNVDLLGEAIDYAIANGARVINMSIGADRQPSSFVAALRSAADAGIFMTISAGNQGDSQPQILAQAANLDGVLTNMLIVGAINRNANFANFSSRAGGSRNNYVVAPGDDIRIVGAGNSFEIRGGTSVSAPHVAGAAALLFSVFPNLDGADIFTLLTTTATDFGADGVDNIFGWGLINIGNAMQPQGTTTFLTAIPGTEDFTETPIDTSGSGFSIAFGDAFSQMDALQSVMMLDSFERSYFVDATANFRPLYPSTLSLVHSLESRHMTQSLYMPVSATNGISFSFHYQNRFVREIAYALSPATQSTLQQVMPATYFDTQLSKSWSMSTAFGFSPGNVMDRHGGDRVGYSGFLAARFDGAMHLGITQNPKTATVQKRFKKQTSLMFGTMIGSYDYDHLPFAARNTNAKAYSTFARAQKAFGRFNVNVTVGILQEENAILGSLSTGALQLGTGATTTFTGIQGEASLGKGFSLFAQYNSGWTNVEGASGTMINGISSFRTSSFTAAVLKNGVFSARDRIGLAIHQPLRVEGGTVNLSIPTDRNYVSDRILFSQSLAPITPSSREIDIELSYRLFEVSGLNFEANYVYQFNPGHSSDLKNAMALLFRLSQSY